MDHAALGATIFLVCSALIAGAVLVARRLNRRDAVRAAGVNAWSDRSTRLVEELHGSTFTRIVFDSDDPRLEFASELRTVLTIPQWPTVVVGSRILRFGDPGFRQAVLSLQGDTVRSARTSTEREVVIEFSRGSLVIEPATPG